MGKQIKNMFNVKSRPTPKGNAGYDNARENIDPHIKTQVLNTKEIDSDKLNVSYINTDGSFCRVGSAVAGAYNLDIEGNMRVSNPGTSDGFISFESPGSVPGFMAKVNVGGTNHRRDIRFETYSIALVTSSDDSKPDDFNGINIREDGSVGIYTTSPDAKLQVVGDCKFGDDNTNYISIGTTGNITFTGSAGFYPRMLTQDAEPAAGTGATQIDSGELLIWIDTNDSNKQYLCFNYSGTVNTILLS